MEGLVQYNRMLVLPNKFVPAQQITHFSSQWRLVRQNNMRQTRGMICLATQSSGLSSVSLGPSTDAEAGSSQQNGANVPRPADVALHSEAGQDYTVLQERLQNQEFEKADDETRALLIRLAGPDAEKRGWVYFTEVKFIPEADLHTIDNLWKAASNDNFGYSVQKEIWIRNRQRWDKFFQQIDWVHGEHNIYRKWPKEFQYSTSAARGHLPLTNALRGTRLFQAIMEHPAFEKQNKEAPSWLS